MTTRRGMGMALPGLGVTLALAGCATGPSLSERLSAWVGRSEAEVVAHFGVPVRTHEAEGRHFLQYEDRRAQLLASDPWWGWPHGRYWAALPPPPSYVVRRCDVTFTLRQGVVEAFSYRGDGCY